MSLPSNEGENRSGPAAGAGAEAERKFEATDLNQVAARMDQFSYKEAGNEVTLVMRFDPEDPQ